MRSVSYIWEYKENTKTAFMMKKFKVYKIKEIFYCPSQNISHPMIFPFVSISENRQLGRMYKSEVEKMNWLEENEQ